MFRTCSGRRSLPLQQSAAESFPTQSVRPHFRGASGTFLLTRGADRGRLAAVGTRLRFRALLGWKLSGEGAAPGLGGRRAAVGKRRQERRVSKTPVRSRHTNQRY